MPIPFTLGKIKGEFPVGWHETTLKQVIDYGKQTNEFSFCERMEVFTGISRKLWNDLEINQANVAWFNTMVQWTRSMPDWTSYPVPEKVTINGKEIHINKRMELKVIGQLQKWAERCGSKLIPIKEADGIKAIPFDIWADAIAIFLQPEYTGKKFDPDTLDEMLPHVMKLPAIEAMPLGNFFLKVQENLKIESEQLSIRRMQKLLKRREKDSTALVS